MPGVWVLAFPGAVPLGSDMHMDGRGGWVLLSCPPSLWLLVLVVALPSTRSAVSGVGGP